MLCRFAHIRRSSLQKYLGILRLNSRGSQSLSFGLLQSPPLAAAHRVVEIAVFEVPESIGAAHVTNSQRSRVLPEPTSGFVYSHHDSDKYHWLSLNKHIVLSLLV